VKASSDEPAISSALRRPLAALWISLGLHAALIALVQVAPPAATHRGETVIEARLVRGQPGPAVVQTPAVETPDERHDEPASLAPAETAETVPVATPAAAPSPPPDAPAAAPGAAAPQAAAAAAAGVASAPEPAATLTSAVDLTYYSARELDVQPRALRAVVPDYPADADRERLSGKVRLQLRLEADGRISDIEIVGATPPGVFEESARKAFGDARFSPAQKNGRPVRALVLIEVVYDWEGRLR
jgi:protein TonB